MEDTKVLNGVLGKNMEPSKIVFSVEDCVELLKIEHLEEGNGKIIFNKEAFPDYGVDEFATKFIDILHNCVFNSQGVIK